MILESLGNAAGRNPRIDYRRDKFAAIACAPFRGVKRERFKCTANLLGREDCGSGNAKTALPPWQHRDYSSSRSNARSSNAAVSGFTSSLRWM